MPEEGEWMVGQALGKLFPRKTPKKWLNARCHPYPQNIHKILSACTCKLCVQVHTRRAGTRPGPAPLSTVAREGPLLRGAASAGPRVTAVRRRGRGRAGKRETKAAGPGAAGGDRGQAEGAGGQRPEPPRLHGGGAEASLPAVPPGLAARPLGFGGEGLRGSPGGVGVWGLGWVWGRLGAGGGLCGAERL